MTPEKLKSHPFVLQAFEESSAALRELKKAGIDPDSVGITEYDFYLFRVSHALAHLLSWSEQLQDAPTYLADFNYTGKVRKNGITRARYLLYTVENYLIRLQSIYDRCLQLTNSVFHLCIEDSNVGHGVIVSNLQVSRTDVVALLKRVRKAVVGKQQDRHSIIHHASYAEKDLDRLQLFYLYDKSTWDEALTETKFENLAYMRSQLLRKVVAEKRKEFQIINESLFSALNELLTGLQPHYRKQSDKITAYLKS